jgi:hypothetical protein
MKANAVACVAMFWSFPLRAYRTFAVFRPLFPIKPEPPLQKQTVSSEPSRPQNRHLDSAIRNPYTR